MIYLHYKDTKTFGHSFSFLLIFNALSANYLQVGNFSQFRRATTGLSHHLQLKYNAKLRSNIDKNDLFEYT